MKRILVFFVALLTFINVNAYTITYELDGGTNSSKNPSTIAEGAGITFSNPTKKGYIFDGWYRESTFKTKIEKVGSFKHDLVIYAKWTGVSYKLEFVGNGATNVSSYTQNMTYGTNSKLTANKYIRDGYTFKEWNLKADGSGKGFTDLDSVCCLSVTNGATIKLYAIWEIKKLAITYNLNGGTNNGNNPKTINYGSSLTLANPTRTGYTFDGWYRESTFKTKIEKVGSFKYDLVIYAKWIAHKYTIQFNGNGATNVNSYSQSMTYGTGTKLTLNKFIREGYNFKEWNTKVDGSGISLTDQQNVSALSTVDNATVKLYAIWEIKKLTITYNLNGGVNNKNNPTTVNYGTSLTFSNPTRNGYKFLGWYRESTFKTKIEKVGSFKNNLTIYAKWEAIVTEDSYDCKITYNLNGGTNNKNNPSVVKSGSSLVLSDPTRTGYIFEGWYRESTFNTKIEKVGSFKYDLVVYAKWSEDPTYKDLKITYYLNGGTNSKNNPSVIRYGSSLEFSDPTRTGYIFEGWYRESTFNTKIEKVGSFKYDLVIYAKWKPIQYKVEFNGNGAINVSSYIQTVDYGSSVSLISNKFVRDGYELKEWNTKADGSGKTYSINNKISNLSTTNGATIKLYAIWTSNNTIYNITYVLNGGVNSSYNPTTILEGEGLTFSNPLRTGYTFGGWYTDKDLTKKITKVGSFKRNLTVYAKWIANTYTIEFISKHATNNVETYSMKATYGTAIKLLKNKYKRTGYVFNYWNTKEDGSGTKLTDQQSVSGLTSSNNGIVKLYAIWKRDYYKVTYNLNGGTNNSKNVSTVKINEKLTLYNPTRSGYEFLGWYKDSSFKTKVTGVSKMNSDLTLYAKWLKYTYNSSTLKYSYYQDGKYDLVRIWVKDATKQFGIYLANNNKGGKLQQVSVTANQLITNNKLQSKGMVITNGSISAGENPAKPSKRWSPYLYDKSESGNKLSIPSWENYPVVPVIINNGTVIKNFLRVNNYTLPTKTGVEKETWFGAKTYFMDRKGQLGYVLFKYGITEDGREYNKEKEKYLLKNALYTFGATPVFVYNYQKKALPNTDFGQKTKAKRNAVCQIDDNIFYLVSNIGLKTGNDKNKISTLVEFQDYLIKLGCKTAFNIDGGGTLTTYYKTSTNKLNKINVVENPNGNPPGRITAEALYFREQ